MSVKTWLEELRHDQRHLRRMILAATLLFVMMLIVFDLADATFTAAFGRPRPTASESTAALGSVPALRSMETPGIVVDDMALDPDSCNPVVVDAALGLVRPDPRCTPGAIDPRVRQDNIDQTICRSGFTARSDVRPPSSATNKAKARSLDAYGMTYARTIEFDHLVSLQLGGASTVSNLWPEPNEDGASSVNNPKDEIENKLAAAVCRRLVTLDEAQRMIANDWTTAFHTLGITETTGRTRQLCRAGRCVPASKP